MEHFYHEIVNSNDDWGVRFYYSQVDTHGYVPFHWHLDIEVVYVQSGQVSFNFAKQTIELNANQFIIIPSAMMHAVSNIANEAFVLQIPLAFISKFWDEPEDYLFRLDKTDNAYQEVAKLLADLGEIYRRQAVGYRLAFNAQLYAIMYEIFTKLADKGNTELGRTTRIKEVITYLNANFDQNLKVGTIAEMFSYHPNYLSHLFRQEMGMTVKDYLYQLRINKFYQELITTVDPVWELMERYQLTNKHVTLKRFKVTYGLTPLQVRKKATNDD